MRYIYRHYSYMHCITTIINALPGGSYRRDVELLAPRAGGVCLLVAPVIVVIWLLIMFVIVGIYIYIYIHIHIYIYT